MHRAENSLVNGMRVGAWLTCRRPERSRSEALQDNGSNLVSLVCLQIFFLSFLRYYGYRSPLSASDIVYRYHIHTHPH